MHLGSSSLRLLGAFAFAGAMALDGSVARAGTPEDIQGVSARTNAMGGAGTALPGDSSATYYNPAGLGFCRDNSLSIDVRHTLYSLDYEYQGTPADQGPDKGQGPKANRNQTRLTIGGCVKLPFHLSFGIMVGVGMQNPMSLHATTPTERPQYMMYGEPLEQLSITIGLAYRPLRQLSLGLGASILIHSDLAFTALTPLAGAPVEVAIDWDLKPTASPYAGIMIEPIRRLRFGASVRGQLYHYLDTPAKIGVSLGGSTIPFDLRVQSIGWYTPRQFAVGVSGEPFRNLTLAADVTYYQWSVLNKTGYYPFLHVTPEEGASNPAGALEYSEVKHPGWKDSIAFRAGGELRLADERLALRAGYGLRTQGVKVYDDSNVNLLDANTHTITFGGGYTIGERAIDRERARAAINPARPHAPPDEPPVVGTETPGIHSYDPSPSTDARPAGQFGTTPPSTSGDLDSNPYGGQSPGAQARTELSPTAASATVTTAQAVTPAAEVERPSLRKRIRARLSEELAGVNATIDLFFRASVMPTQTVASKQYTFGGTIYDIGGMLTLGWR